MITLFRSNQICAINELKTAMAEHIRQLPNQIAPIGTQQKILRYELSCKPMNILAWLHNNQIELDKVYWSDRQKAFEIGGIGTADLLHGEGTVNHKDLFDYMENRLSADNPNLKYYGGMNFHSSNKENLDWASFGSYRFVVPQFEFYQESEKCVFAFNVALEHINEEHIVQTLKTLESIDFLQTTDYRKVPVVLNRTDYPNQEQWHNIFSQVHRQHQKIVLARKSTFDFDVAIRPMALIKHLKDMTPNCFHFCFQTKNNLGFLGASPERLFKRTCGVIETEAIAGTIARGKSDDEDAQLALDLSNSSKNTNEHRYVVDDLKNKLSQICSSVQFDEQSSLLKLDIGQHLITKFKGELKEHIFDDQILTLLHPTPAVAGTPAEAVIKTIEEVEPFNRGWYAGPVGYIGSDTVEFAVAIRSGLVHENQFSLYAGAGIVEDSNSDEEWQEIENKISSFIKVFNK